MSVAVEMVSYVCRWCGCPFSLPRVLAERSGFSPRCPTGHAHWSRESPEEEIRSLEARRNELLIELEHEKRSNAALRGQLTKLKKQEPK